MIHKGYLTDTHPVSQEKVEKKNYATLCFSKHQRFSFIFFHDTQRVSGRYPQLHITRKSEKKIYAPVGKPSPRSESTAWIFPLYFQLHYLPEETSFQQGGSSALDTNLKSQNSTSPKGVSLNHDPMTRCSIMSAYISHPLCTAHFVNVDNLHDQRNHRSYRERAWPYSLPAS